jgi:hypothetical protein
VTGAPGAVVGWIVVTPPAALPTRRSVVAGGLAALALPVLGGCERDTKPARPPRPDPDVVRADEAAARERALLAAYDAAVAAVPALAARLTPLRAEHALHLAALGVPERPTTSPPALRATAPPQPTDPPALLAALADLERRTAVAHGDEAVLAGRGLAAVLAALAASEASHPVALR